jgi:hypothetical protein
VTYASAPTDLNLSTESLEFIKPTGWSRRKAPGEIQRAAGDLIQARLRMFKGLQDYDNLLNQIEDQANLLQAQYGVNAKELELQNTGLNTQKDLNLAIIGFRAGQLALRTAGHVASATFDALAEMLPTAFGLAVDATAPGRGALRLTGALLSDVSGSVADTLSLSELGEQQAKEETQAANNIELTTTRQVQGITNQIAQLRQLVRQEPALRLEVYSLREGVLQSAGNYRATLEKGIRLLDERTRFRVQTAAEVQRYRYKDMAFRIFRDDAIQKFRAQFDVAARYVYLAAKAYDYETCLLPGDPRGLSGQDFLTRIVKSRAIGLIENGQPVGGSANIPSGAGDLGLADPLAQMSQNFYTIKGSLGFNNPQTQPTRFSLRSELLRIAPGTAGKSTWQQQLSKYIVTNLWELPEYRKYCSLLSTNQSVPEPAIVIPFSTTVTFRENFFGWPLAAGDSYYAADRYATKVRSVGVWFANYNSVSGLAQTPRIYLFPIGTDVLRSPTGNAGVIRDFPVLDQILPTPYLSSSSLADPGWIPINSTIGDGQFADIRRFETFQAYHDGGYNLSEMTYDSRLIGRSVWNTGWLMIIPSGNLFGSGALDEGIQRFINGISVNGVRDGNGVSDIKITFQTYSY